MCIFLPLLLFLLVHLVWVLILPVAKRGEGLSSRHVARARKKKKVSPHLPCISCTTNSPFLTLSSIITIQSWAPKVGQVVGANKLCPSISEVSDFGRLYESHEMNLRTHNRMIKGAETHRMSSYDRSSRFTLADLQCPLKPAASCVFPSQP